MTCYGEGSDPTSRDIYIWISSSGWPCTARGKCGSVGKVLLLLVGGAFMSDHAIRPIPDKSVTRCLIENVILVSTELVLFISLHFFIFWIRKPDVYLTIHFDVQNIYTDGTVRESLASSGNNLTQYSHIQVTVLISGKSIPTTTSYLEKLMWISCYN